MSSRFSGIGAALSTIADKLRKDREMQADTGQKTNLLGVEGLISGKIAPAQQGEQGAMNIPGVGNVKSVANQPDKWDIQKEARTTVNAMINQNPVLQAQVFQNPKLVTDLIDKEVERLSEKYRGGGLTSPISSPEIPTSTPLPTPKFTPPKITPTEERINVISPEGKKGTIPRSQLDDALKTGFKRTIK